MNNDDTRRDFLKQASLAVCGSLAAGGFAVAKEAAPVVAETATGKIRGVDLNGIKLFRGIPYGGSTAGGNRFMPPTKAPKWSGVRDGSEWGHISPQTLVTNPGDYEKTIEWDKERGGMGEDCLNLNIWTPALKDGGKRTVMVSYHGGGFTTGSGNLGVYDGEPLARFGDVVVVTVNHRLGALGYTDLSALGGLEFAYSGVAGMMDCVAALEWVRDNIENFGGNPKSVMIFGQSGGGAKTSTLLSMPSAKGLFHRAAVQSGSTIRLTHHDAASKTAEQLLAALGLDKSRLAELQNVPFEKIVAAQKTTGPVVDGKIIPRDPFDPGAPEVSAGVPMIIGSELEDAGLRMRDWDLTESGLKTWAEETVNGHGDRVVALYRKSYPQLTPFLIKAMIASDRAVRHNATLQAERKAALGHAPAYLYRWDWPSPAYGGKFGAIHGTDVSMAFHNAAAHISMETPDTPPTPQAKAMAERLGSVWVAFAKTGDPNNKQIPHWPAYNAKERPTMIFDNNTRVENDPNHEIRVMWGRVGGLRGKEVYRFVNDPGQFIKQFMIGIEFDEVDAGMASRYAARKFNRDHVVVNAVENQRGLFKIRAGREPQRVTDQVVMNAAGGLVSVVEDLDVRAFRDLVLPSGREAECGRHQDQGVHLGMHGSIEGGKVSAHAGADEPGWLAAERSFQKPQLSGDRQMPEIAFVHSRDFERQAPLRHRRGESLRLPRLRTGGEAVDVNKPHSIWASGSSESRG